MSVTYSTSISCFEDMVVANMLCQFISSVRDFNQNVVFDNMIKHDPDLVVITCLICFYS